MKTHHLPIPVLVLVLLTAACGLFAWIGMEAGPDRESTGPLELADVGADEDPKDPRLGYGRIPATSVEQIAGSDVRRSEVEGDLAEAIEGGFLEIQVWDGKEGVPAVRARVFLLNTFDFQRRRDPYAPHWSEQAEKEGRTFRTNAKGRVSLPPVESRALVTATLPGKYGYRMIGRRHREVESLTLQPDETVTVCVLDGAGRPVASAPVGIAQRIPERPREERRDEAQVLERRLTDAKRWAQANPERRTQAIFRVKGLLDRQAEARRENRRDRRRRGANREPEKPRVESPTPAPMKNRRDIRARRLTDEGGLAVFRHFQLYRQRSQKWWPEDLVDRFACLLLMPSPEPIQEHFVGAPSPEATLTLRMPPAGELVLRTVDLEGNPYRHPVSVDLRASDAKDGVRPEVRQRKPANEETIVFPFVELGRTFVASCRLDDRDFRWELKAIVGPAEPGQTASRDLVVAPDAGMLTGRILDPAGEPLEGQRPTFLINSAIGRLEGEDVTLDDTGRFHLPFQLSERHRGPFHLEVRHGREPRTGWEMPLEELRVAQVTDLGDLRLEESPLIASGRVVDDRGEPIRGANVQLQAERPRSGQDTAVHFVDEAFGAVRTNAEGRYELHGVLELARWRLQVTARNCFTEHVESLGQGDVIDVTLTREAAVIGTILAPDWLPNDQMTVRLRPVASEGDVLNDVPRDLFEDGLRTFLFNRVRPGFYELEIRVRQFPDPILTIPAFEVLPAQRDVHPALREIYLRSSLHRFEILAVDDRGTATEPDRPLLAKIARPDGTEGFVGFPWRDGRAEVFSVSPTLEVLAMAMGYQAQSTVLAAGRNQLVFRALPLVDVHVPGLRAFCGEAPVSIGMVPRGELGMPRELQSWDRSSSRIARWYRWGRASYAELGTTDVARLKLIRSGSYRVMANVGRRGRGRRPASVSLASVEVTLVPGAPVQRISVAFDPEAVRKGLAEFARSEAAAAQRRRNR